MPVIIRGGNSLLLCAFRKQTTTQKNMTAKTRIELKGVIIE